MKKVKLINLILSNGSIIVGEEKRVDEKGNITINKPIIFENEQFLRDFLAPQINNEKIYYKNNIVSIIELKKEDQMQEEYLNAVEQLYKLSEKELEMHKSKEDLIMLQLSSGYQVIGVLIKDKDSEIEIKYPMRVFINSDGTNLEISLSAMNPLSLNDLYYINKSTVLSYCSVNNKSLEDMFEIYSSRVYNRPQIEL